MNEYHYDYVLRLHELIIPRLESTRNFGDASTIHKANSFIGTIYGWKSLYEREHEFTDLVTWREYIRSAELWLIEKGKEK